MLIKRQWKAFFLFDSMWEETNIINASEGVRNSFCRSNTRHNLSKWEVRYQNTEPEVVPSCWTLLTLRLTAKEYRFDTFEMLEVRTMLIFFHQYNKKNKSSLYWDKYESSDHPTELLNSIIFSLNLEKIIAFKQHYFDDIWLCCVS